MVAFLRNNANNGTGIDGVVYEGTVARRIAVGEVAGIGNLTRVSSDGLPGMNRVDTLTSQYAIQVKHTSGSGTLHLSSLGGSTEAGTQYLDDLTQQAASRGKVPAIIYNNSVGATLRAEADMRGIELIRVPSE